MSAAKDTLVIPTKFRSRDGSAQPIDTMHCTCGFYGGEFVNAHDIDRKITDNLPSGKPITYDVISKRQWNTANWVRYPDHVQCLGCDAEYPGVEFDYPDGTRGPKR